MNRACFHQIKYSDKVMSYDLFVFVFRVSAGYNNLEVAEYLLQHGAEVNSQDKGGLIPLHNAASYGVSLISILMLTLATQVKVH